VEQGSHQALLALRGTYFRLYQMQFSDEPPAGELHHN